MVPPGEAGYRWPAEWEPQASMWLAWPHDPHTWVLGVEEAEASYLEMIDALAPHQRADLLVPDETTAARVRALLDERDVQAYRVHVVDYADSWLRDTGPTFLVHPTEALVGVDWRFNAWGGKYETLLRDDRLARIVCELAGVSRYRVETVMEGGAIDSNGFGSVLTTEQSLLHPNRGGERDHQGMEELLGDVLGAENVLWLGEGIVGDDTDGHVDDIARFVDRSTVVAATEPDPNRDNHRICQANLDRLTTMTDERGKPLEVIELPLPAPMEAEGVRVPATYTNFTIANGTVLLPVYQDPQDEATVEVFQDLFPDRVIAPIPARALVAGFGACHCLTQQQPQEKPHQRMDE